jgi:hypothetical protein
MFFMKPAYFISFAEWTVLLMALSACGNNADKTNSSADTAAATTTVAVPKNETKAPLDTGIATGPVAINNLPATVRPYVEKNFPGYAIANATHDPLCTGGDAIDVVITGKKRPTLSLIFLPDGSFVQKEEDVSYKTAPKKVTDVIKANYADFKPSKQIEKLTLADNTTEYLVDITKGNKAMEVILSKDGVLVCEH